MKKRAKYSLMGKYCTLVFASLLILLPVLWMISTSFKSTPEVMNGKVTWIPQDFTAEAYVRISVIIPLRITIKAVFLSHLSQ